MIGIVALAGGITWYSFEDRRNRRARSSCVANLHQIKLTKERVTAEHHLATGDVIERNTFLATNGLENLECPMGGIYSIGAVGENPECDFAKGTGQEHALSVTGQSDN